MHGEMIYRGGECAPRGKMVHGHIRGVRAILGARFWKFCLKLSLSTSVGPGHLFSPLYSFQDFFLEIM